jgi:hypothetical protein
MSTTSPSAQPREKFFPICFIQKAKFLVDFSLKLIKTSPCSDNLSQSLLLYLEIFILSCVRDDTFNPFLHIYAFMVWANSVDPDQSAQLCHLIRV